MQGSRRSDDGNEFRGIYNGDPDACVVVVVVVLSIVSRGKRLQLRGCDVIIVSPAWRSRRHVSSKKSVLPSVTVTAEASDAMKCVGAAARLRLEGVELILRYYSFTMLLAMNLRVNRARNRGQHNLKTILP